MLRVRSVLAALLLSALVTPAQAETAPHLGLRASDMSVTTGERITLSGRAVGLPVGRSIKLMHRTGNDAWAAMKTTRVRRDHSWRTVTTPLEGAHRYRAVARHRTGRVVSRALEVVATAPTQPAAPTVTLSWSHELQTIESSEGAYWHNDLWGTVSGEASEDVVLQTFDGTTWVPTDHSTTITPDGSYRFFFLDWELRNALLRVCVPPAGSRPEGCSTPVRTDDTRFVADVDLLAITSTIREETTSSGDVRHYQEAIVTGRTNLPPGVLIGTEYRLPGRAEWGGYQGRGLPMAGEFTLMVPTPPDSSDVRLTVAAWGDVAYSESEPLPYELKPFHVDLGDPAPRIRNIPTGRGALIRFDAEAGQVFHAVAYESGNTSVDMWVEGPDGTTLQEKRLVPRLNDTGTWYYQASTAGRHTVVLSSGHPGWLAAAFTDVMAPSRVTGPAHHYTRVTTSRNYQVAEYHFSGTAGQVVTLPRNDWSQDCASVDLLAAGDYENPLPRLFGQDWETHRIWALPADGDYLYRVTPCWGEQVSYQLQSPAPTEQHLEVTNDIQEVTLPPGGWAKLTFEARAGDHIRLQMSNDESHDLYDPDTTRLGGIGASWLTAPDGTRLSTDFEAPQTGTYTLWAEQGTYFPPATSTWRVLLRELHP